MFEIIWMVTVLTASGPVTSDVQIMMSDFDQKPQCVEFGETLQGSLQFLLNAGSFRGVVPLSDDVEINSPIKIEFRCE